MKPKKTWNPIEEGSLGQAPGNPLTRSVARLGKCPQRKWETCKPKAQPPWKTSTSSAVVLSSNPVRGQFILAAAKQNKTQLSESSHKVVHLFATIRGALIAHPQPSPPKCYFHWKEGCSLRKGLCPGVALLLGTGCAGVQDCLL